MAEIEQLNLFDSNNKEASRTEQHTLSHSQQKLNGSPSDKVVPPSSRGGTAPSLPGLLKQEAGLWETETQETVLPNLDAVARAVGECNLCKLSNTRTNAVPGEGNPKARITFIGEGPGADEDAQGRPFVGAAGRLLDRLIISMGLEREDVFIGNVVKCRPPRNRDPEPDEVKACMPYLARQIELTQPDVMVILGATALRALIDPKAKITRMRGTWLERSGIRVMPTFHPAALLRDPSRKILVWEDMKKVMAFLRETH